MASPPFTRREYAYLRIIGKGHHKIITETLGIEPTNAWNEGEDNPRNNKAWARIKLPIKSEEEAYSSNRHETYRV